MKNLQKEIIDSFFNKNLIEVKNNLSQTRMDYQHVFIEYLFLDRYKISIIGYSEENNYSEKYDKNIEVYFLSDYSLDSVEIYIYDNVTFLEESLDLKYLCEKFNNVKIMKSYDSAKITLNFLLNNKTNKNTDLLVSIENSFKIYAYITYLLYMYKNINNLEVSQEEELHLLNII